MSFADENVEYDGRSFVCGWLERPQTAADIATRSQDLARRLSAIDPAYGRLYPDPGARRLRPGDPGPILEMETESLADYIDRRERFDPPRFPEPVSPTGYHFAYRNDCMGNDPSSFGMIIRAGQYGPGGVENRAEAWPAIEHPLWRDVGAGIMFMDAMVQAWKPEWACAYSRPPALPIAISQGPSPVRPWLAWTLKPLQPRPDPPFRRPYPYPFPLDDAGPPAEVRPWLGGELRIWP
jgi:hypothetical protein